MRLSLKVIIIVVGLVTVFMSTLFIGLIIRINSQSDDAMLATARAIYRNVVITRKWVSDLDGVLVKKQPGMIPNPFLVHPQLVTSQGDTLLLKNPALVTRELSMLSDSLGGEFTYHLASERYLNPINQPDPFERAALQFYEGDSAAHNWEYFRLERRDGRQFFRYFAPLYTHKSCLTCHAQQGYQEGDLRGGISVLVSADKYLADRRSNIAFMLGMAGIAIILLSVLMYISLQRSIIIPLHRMEETATRFEDGNYHFDLDLPNRDEIGRLAHAFKVMGRRIQRFTDRLRQSEQKYRRIIENSPEAVAVIDAETNLIECNENLVRLSGRPTEELHNMTLKGLLDLDHQHPIKGARQEDGPPADVQHFESSLFTVDQRQIPVEVTITGGLTLADQNNLAFVYLRDLSERKQMEKVSIQSEKLFALGRLSSGMAHEIRNPLFALNNNLGYLKENSRNPEVLDSIFPELQDSVERIQRIVSTVLDYARPHQVKFVAVDLNNIVYNALDLVRKHIDHAQVTTQLELAEDLSAVQGDRHQLEQVLINLIMNAVQAMNPQGRLTITTRPCSGCVQLVVEDTGSGIDPEDLNHIFDPFFTKSAGGTGLGLSVSQRILDQHNAQYEVHSEKNMGTRFTITFPHMESTLT